MSAPDLHAYCALFATPGELSALYDAINKGIVAAGGNATMIGAERSHLLEIVTHSYFRAINGPPVREKILGVLIFTHVEALTLAQVLRARWCSGATLSNLLARLDAAMADAVGRDVARRARLRTFTFSSLAP